MDFYSWINIRIAYFLALFLDNITTHNFRGRCSTCVGQVQKCLEFFQNLVLKFQNVRGKVHGNQEVKSLRFMGKRLVEKIREISEANF